MSVRIAVRFPSVIKPIATPAQADFTGTPASISASDPLQTVAMDDEPFDSRTSDTMRIVYGNCSYGGRIACSARSASAPWPISRRETPRTGFTSPVQNGGGVWGRKNQLGVFLGASDEGDWLAAGLL